MRASATAKPGSKEVVVVASGDSRLSASQRCWPAPQTLEKVLEKATKENVKESLAR